MKRIEDIIIMALTENTLCEEGYAVKRSGYNYTNDINERFKTTIKIYYTLNNDIDNYSWADTENGKGVIYRMSNLALFNTNGAVNFDAVGLRPRQPQQPAT